MKLPTKHPKSVGVRLIPVATIVVLMAMVSGGTDEPPPSDAQTARNEPTSRPVSADESIARVGRGIVGSKHDFSHSGRVPRDLCTPCHTPHITATQAPLLVSGGNAEKSSRSFQTPAGQLDAASLVCLSCHDGTIAPDVYAGSHATSWSDRSTGNLPPGRSRLTNHPIGIAYPDGKPKFNSSAAVTAGGKIKLPGGRIQCTTCHDPHNTDGVPKLLVISNERSRLCLSCHRL